MNNDNSNTIYNILNEIFTKLFSSVDNSIYSVLDEFAFIDKNIIEKSGIKLIIGDNLNSGILLICDSLVLGIIIFYAVNHMMSHITLGKSQRPSQFIFRMIIFVICMNFSVWICDEIINIVDLITKILLQLGESLFNKEISFSNFITLINKQVYNTSEGLNILSFDGVVKSFTTYGLMNLIFMYSLRYVLLEILIIILPVAFLSLSLDKTDWFFKVWIKLFLTLLLEQILIAIILLLGFSIGDINNSKVLEMIYIGVIYALMSTNSYMKQIFNGVPSSLKNGISDFVNS